MGRAITGHRGIGVRLGLILLSALLGLALLWSVSWSATNASAQQASNRVYAITGQDRLISFPAGNPRRVLTATMVKGLDPGERLVGMDFRPENRRLYAISDASQVYVITLSNGQATPVGEPFTPALEGATFGVDFNPTVDLIRLVSNTGQNLRISPETGQVTTEDTDLMYTLVPPDENAGTPPNVVGAAYTNNFAGSTATVLYDIDFNLDILADQTPANDGTLNTIGPLGVDTTALVGFDITGADTAYASLKQGTRTKTSFHTVNLETGRATGVSLIGGRLVVGVKDIAVFIPPAPE